MHKLTSGLLLVFGLLPLMSSCSSSSVTGSGYLIGKIERNQVGRPVFKKIDPEHGSVTYVDRVNGIIFVSANEYETYHHVDKIESGPDPYPASVQVQNDGIEKAVSLVQCTQKGDCRKIEICDGVFSVRTSDPMKVYTDMKMRSFPVAELSYVEHEAGIYDIKLSYFTDCALMKSDLRAVVGEGNILDS